LCGGSELNTHQKQEPLRALMATRSGRDDRIN
jgi:hypothetical protein